jgi:two-component system, OmpR family, sensor histidine kinase KdpD
MACYQMENRSPIQVLARLTASLFIVAAITFFFLQIADQVNHTTIALTFLMATLGIAAGWGLLEAIAASIASMLCFNYFFIPPVGTFTIADPQNWIALFAFLLTAVIASQLSASAKKKASEATRRRQEIERLYDLSRNLMLLEKSEATAQQIANRIVRTFDAAAVAVHDLRADHTGIAGLQDLPIPLDRLKDAALQGVPFQDKDAKLRILPLRLSGDPAGSIALAGGTISEAALNAIANLAAIAIERARAEDAAAHMEAARQNEAMKSMLLDALAHEFKTPLTSIKAAASSLLDEGPEAQRELAAVIGEETERLNSLVNETIHMARIEAGELKLHERPEQIRDIVDSALEKLKILLEDREIRTDVPDSLPAVLADAELVGLTIRQLITNALKYSHPESPIAVIARMDGARMKISVRDSGPGIPDKERSRIFEKYYRGTNGSQRIPGTGLGLSIARDILRAHGGEIWVENAPAGGSEFCFTLPAVKGIESQ